MKRKRWIETGIVIAALAAGISGCGSSASADKETNESTASGGVKTIQVGYVTSSYPLSYEDENGNLTGYEIEVLKLVDEKLKDYQFEYSSAAQDALYTGLGSGQYDLVISNAFYTEDRAKNYILTENPLGASLVGLVVPKGTKDVTDFESAAKKKLSISPVMSGDGLYYVLYKYNEEHKDNQIEINVSDSPDAFQNSISWVADGRYDYAIYPRNFFESLVKAEDGSLHEYNDKVDFIESNSVYTYPVIAKDEQTFADEVNDALGELKEEGKLEELSEKFYGYNAFQYDNE